MIIGALLVALVGGTIYSMVALSGANRWVRHTDEVRFKIAQLKSTLLDAETGLRGYLLTGSTPFLAPYDSARSSWHRQLEELSAVTGDNEVQQARLRTLAAL